MDLWRGWLVGLGFGRLGFLLDRWCLPAGFMDAFWSVGLASLGRFRWVRMG
jgi:hypothetical protein